jgi:outer membrane lipoprotein SlyB
MAGAEPVAHAAGAALEAGAELYAVGVAGAVAGAVIASSARAAVPKIESREIVSREDVAVKVRMTRSPVVSSERVAARRRC